MKTKSSKLIGWPILGALLLKIFPTICVQTSKSINPIDILGFFLREWWHWYGAILSFHQCWLHPEQTPSKPLLCFRRFQLPWQRQNPKLDRDRSFPFSDLFRSRDCVCRMLESWFYRKLLELEILLGMCTVSQTFSWFATRSRAYLELLFSNR